MTRPSRQDTIKVDQLRASQIHNQHTVSLEHLCILLPTEPSKRKVWHSSCKTDEKMFFSFLHEMFLRSTKQKEIA